MQCGPRRVRPGQRTRPDRPSQGSSLAAGATASGRSAARANWNQGHRGLAGPARRAGGPGSTPPAQTTTPSRSEARQATSRRFHSGTEPSGSHRGGRREVASGIGRSNTGCWVLVEHPECKFSQRRLGAITGGQGDSGTWGAYSPCPPCRPWSPAALAGQGAGGGPAQAARLQVTFGFSPALTPRLGATRLPRPDWCSLS